MSNFFNQKALAILKVKIRQFTFSNPAPEASPECWPLEEHPSYYFACYVLTGMLSSLPPKSHTSVSSSVSYSLALDINSKLYDILPCFLWIWLSSFSHHASPRLSCSHSGCSLASSIVLCSILPAPAPFSWYILPSLLVCSVQICHDLLPIPLLAPKDAWT